MTTSRRVLLVNPVPLYAGGLASGRARLQPGLISIFSYLTAHGVTVDVLDLHVELGVPSLADVDRCVVESTRRVLERDFDLLAISCNSSFHLLGAMDLATGVRAVDATVPIVVGGCHASACPDDFTEPGSPFDIVVTGEGEVALLRLALELDCRPTSPETIAGPPLPLDVVAADFEGYPYWHERPHKLTFPLSRGCPFTCTFCAGARRDAWRAYPPSVALRLVEHMMRLRPEVIALSDACFGLHGGWRRAFLAGLAELRPGPVIEFETRVDALTEADLDLLAGMDALVELGVETGSPAMAETMRKAADGEAYLRHVDRTLHALGRRGIPAHVYLLLNHPGETRVSLAETVALAERLRDDPSLTAYATAHRVMLLPGSPVHADLARWQALGTRFAHPRWWHERADHGRRAEAVHAAVDDAEVRQTEKYLLRVRGEAIAALPAAAKLTWRRVRAPLRLPEDRGGLARRA
jgi:radical SAM superfamily enzyme YgiQ (UPF0313 family)